MTLSDDIRAAVRAAQAAVETKPDNPFKQVFEQVAEGLTDDHVQARLTSGSGGRWSLCLAPAYQPGRSFPMLVVVISDRGADVLLDPKQTATTPDQLADILRNFVTTPAFLESLQEIAEISSHSVEGFLRITPGTVSREDIMLEVPSEIQRRIAEAVGQEIALELRVAPFPGAGRFQPEARYQVLESAGLSVTLSKKVEQKESGELHLVGNVEPTAA
jgi:hypothetical protein